MTAGTAIRSLTYILICLSIIVNYQVFIINKDYEIFTNPDGPETEDYFEAAHNNT